MKIATYNANSIRVRLDTVTSWLRSHQPDVLCLQETKCQDADFPALIFATEGYAARFRGMKSYNGVAVLSRVEPERVVFGLNDGELENDDVRLARADFPGFTIVNTYVPNGFKLGSPQYEYKLRWFGRLRKYFERNLDPQRPVIWCGDMNVAPEPMDVHSPEKHLRHVCFHQDARDAYAHARGWGFTDVFRHLHPDRVQFTFWDYLRPGSLEANKGWRIDHILATGPALRHCRSVDVDIEPRRAPRSSDHTFVWAEFDI